MTKKEIVWRKCWSLDLDDVRDEDDSLKYQIDKKERTLIGKIKKKSSNIFRSIEEDINLSINKGKP